jgi:hypothetical protein
MPSYIYHEPEVLERKTNVRIMGNGTVTAGAKYINDPNVRIDVIIIKKSANVEAVNVKNNEHSDLLSGVSALLTKPTKIVL